MKIVVRVRPGSRQESIEWVEDLFGEKKLIVKLRALPINGKANKALLKALSEYFHTPSSRITIIQ